LTPIRMTTAAAFILALGTGTGAIAQTVTAEQPNQIAGIFRDLGYRTELTKDNVGDPLIRIGVSGFNASVFFYGCDDAGQSCKWLQFYSRFNTNDPVPISSANEWNRTHLFGEMTILDDGDPALNYFMTLDGGITRANFEDVVGWWEVTISDFADHIDW